LLTGALSYQPAEFVQKMLIGGTILSKLKPVAVIVDKIIFWDFVGELVGLRIDTCRRYQTEEQNNTQLIQAS